MEKQNRENQRYQDEEKLSFQIKKSDLSVPISNGAQTARTIIKNDLDSKPPTSSRLRLRTKSRDLVEKRQIKNILKAGIDMSHLSVSEYALKQNQTKSFISGQFERNRRFFVLDFQCQKLYYKQSKNSTKIKFLCSFQDVKDYTTVNDEPENMNVKQKRLDQCLKYGLKIEFGTKSIKLYLLTKSQLEIWAERLNRITKTNLNKRALRLNREQRSIDAAEMLKSQSPASLNPMVVADESRAKEAKKMPLLLFEVKDQKQTKLKAVKFQSRPKISARQETEQIQLETESIPLIVPAMSDSDEEIQKQIKKAEEKKHNQRISSLLLIRQSQDCNILQSVAESRQKPNEIVIDKKGATDLESVEEADIDLSDDDCSNQSPEQKQNMIKEAQLGSLLQSSRQQRTRESKGEIITTPLIETKEDEDEDKSSKDSRNNQLNSSRQALIPEDNNRTPNFNGFAANQRLQELQLAQQKIIQEIERIKKHLNQQPDNVTLSQNLRESKNLLATSTSKIEEEKEQLNLQTVKSKGSGGYVSLNRKHRGYFISDMLEDNIFTRQKNPRKVDPPKIIDNTSKYHPKGQYDTAIVQRSEIVEEVEENEQSNRSMSRAQYIKINNNNQRNSNPNIAINDQSAQEHFSGGKTTRRISGYDNSRYFNQNPMSTQMSPAPMSDLPKSDVIRQESQKTVGGGLSGYDGSITNTIGEQKVSGQPDQKSQERIQKQWTLMNKNQNLYAWMPKQKAKAYQPRQNPNGILKNIFNGNQKSTESYDKNAIYGQGNHIYTFAKPTAPDDGSKEIYQNYLLTLNGILEPQMKIDETKVEVKKSPPKQPVSKPPFKLESSTAKKKAASPPKNRYNQKGNDRNSDMSLVSKQDLILNSLTSTNIKTLPVSSNIKEFIDTRIQQDDERWDTKSDIKEEVEIE